MKIAVTGASGFIGKHIVRLLAERGHTPVALVRSPGAEAETRAFDLLDASTFAPAVSGAEAVIHCAAYLPKNYADPDEARRCMDANALATLELLRTAASSGVRRFVYFSSNVYRQSASAVTEESPTYPVSHAPYYMMSKLTGEVWAEHFGRTSAMATVSLRVASVYGPGLGRGMIPTFVGKLLANERITLKDGGRFRSDLVDVADIAMLAALGAERDVRGIFNAGSGSTSSALEIVTALREILGVKSDIVDVEPANEGNAPLGFPALDITKARESLGYAPTPIDVSLRRYVEWHRTRNP